MVALGLVALPAHALAPPTAWDGTNPFACTLQQAGFGATGPDPGADPYCIDFDKRRQNIAELGVVDFLANEPARTAAAVPKCFYFQADHWRGSVIQDDGSTKTYEWDGHYFFDKARAEGGVYVTNFNLNGHTADPSALPGLPPDWSRYSAPAPAGSSPITTSPPTRPAWPRPRTARRSTRRRPSARSRRRPQRRRHRSASGASGRRRASAAPESRVPAGSSTEYAVRPSGSSLCTTGRPTARARGWRPRCA